MTCPFDRAQATEQLQRDLEIAAALATARSTGPSREECRDCGDEIPEARRALGGMTRCVPCQTTFEKRGHR